MHDQHEDKIDHRKLLSIANDGNEDRCVLIDDDTHKRNQCYRLAQCGQNFNLYDLFIFMFGDDIDFETGTIDEKILAFDEKSFRDKVWRQKKLLMISAYIRHLDKTHGLDGIFNKIFSLSLGHEYYLNARYLGFNTLQAE